MFKIVKLKEAGDIKQFFKREKESNLYEMGEVSRKKGKKLASGLNFGVLVCVQCCRNMIFFILSNDLL
jgi:hypothetical protein